MQAGCLQTTYSWWFSLSAPANRTISQCTGKLYWNLTLIRTPWDTYSTFHSNGAFGARMWWLGNYLGSVTCLVRGMYLFNLVRTEMLLWNGTDTLLHIFNRNSSWGFANNLCPTREKHSSLCIMYSVIQMSSTVCTIWNQLMVEQKPLFVVVSCKI